MIRKQFKLGSQSEFAKLLGTTRPAIAKYELGDVIPNDTFIQLLCTKLYINEHWLRTGEGSMEAPNQTATVVDLLQKSFESLDDYDKQVIAAWIEATPEERTAIKQFFDRLKSLQSSEAAQAEHSATIAIRPAANDDHVTREEAH